MTTEVKEMPRVTHVTHVTSSELMVRMQVKAPDGGWESHDMNPDGAEMLGRMLVDTADRVRRAKDVLTKRASEEKHDKGPV